MALGPTRQKRVPDISPGGKGDWWVELTHFPHSFADCLEILEVSTSGALKPVQAHIEIALHLPGRFTLTF